MQPSLFPLKRSVPAAPSLSLISHASLNEAQYEAVTTVAGPALVIAGAGSGKTRTLVYRLAHLVEQGVEPERILLLTFTRKAAQEMLGRASLLLDDSCRRVAGGTFHATAGLLLRRYGHLLGYAANFTIIDQADAEGIVNLLKSSLGFGGEGKRFPSKRVVIAILSKAVNKGLAIKALMEEEYGHLLEWAPEVEEIGRHYQRFKLEHSLMDYDDLLVNWRKVMEEFPQARAELSGRFSHIMVDEYQDTNPIQAAIVRLMASPHDNVMVVGDDSQSIYSFRGADFRNIMEFPNLFPGARLIRLEENYRSTQGILDLTNAIIEKAQEKYSKTLFTRINGGEKPTVHAAADETAQAAFVAETISALLKEGEAADEVAVLFRSGFHSYKLELELSRRQLEFEKRGGLKLNELAHNKDVISYLRVVANPHDHLSWNRLLLQLDKVGPKTAENVLSRIRSAADPLEALAAYPAGKTWRDGLHGLLALLVELREPGFGLVRSFARIMEHYEPVFMRLYPDDYPKRRRDLDELGQIVAGYADLQAFLDDASLDPPQAGETAEQGGRRLVLSTIHSAKGLEWDTVFVINLAEGRFPAAQAVLPAQREEERRLLYVAATRARKRLYLVYPRETAGIGQGIATAGGPSSFLAELPHGLTRSPAGGIRSPFAFAGGHARSLYRRESARPAPPQSPGGQKAGSEAPAPGRRVRHPFFGDGVVEKNLPPKSVEVLFDRHGRKILHLDYARLELL